MNLPNALTFLRIVLAFAFLFFLFSHGILPKVFALFTFLAASLTDALDGFIAKRNNQITDFGKFMDPIADKILVLSAFLAFVEMGLVAAWMVVVVILREAVITGLRIMALTKGKVIPSDGGGKHKMISQVVVIFAILVFVILREGGNGAFGFWNPGIETFYEGAITALMVVTVFLTLISGASYIVKYRGVYSNAKTH